MKTITIAGGNLYQLASEHLGDGTAWNRIAQANGLIDPVIVGTVTLKIPDPDASQTGGVYVR